MSKIDAKYLTKVYKNGAYGLKNCSMSVREGEFLVIVGASGSGKSTLLKVLSGTEELSSGELYIDGILAENIPVSKDDVEDLPVIEGIDINEGIKNCGSKEVFYELVKDFYKFII